MRATQNACDTDSANRLVLSISELTKKNNIMSKTSIKRINTNVNLPTTIFIDLQEKNFNPPDQISVVGVIGTRKNACALYSFQVETINLTTNSAIETRI